MNSEPYFLGHLDATIISRILNMNVAILHIHTDGPSDTPYNLMRLNDSYEETDFMICLL